jgi:hypothetical protein
MHQAFRQQQLVGGGVIMKNFFRTFLVPAIALAVAIAIPAVAQDKAKAPMAKAEKGKATIKVLIDNDRVRVYETTYKPGDVNTEVPSAYHRINRTLQNGTIERTYADGKKEKLELKAGTVRFLEPAKPGAPTYTVQNIGKGDYVSYVVLLKK